MTAPQEEFYPEPWTEALIVLFQIISRESWDELQGWRGPFPESRVEHILCGTYALIIPPGGAYEAAV
jgi:hypothetical protein